MRRCIYGQVVKGHAEALGDVAARLHVVAGHQHDVAVKLPLFVPDEQVVQTVRALADQHGDALALVGLVHAPFHIEVGSRGRNSSPQGRAV